MEGVFLLDNARRQFQKIAADPCLAWLLGWQKDGRIEILNVCRFLSKTGDILQTTDTPYDLDQEIQELFFAFSGDIIPLGCAAVFGNAISMSVQLLVRSLSILSRETIARQKLNPSPGFISGIWCVGELTTYKDGRGCDFQNITAQESHFLSQHIAVGWSFETSVPICIDRSKVFSALPYIGQFPYDLKHSSVILLLEDLASNQKRKVYTGGARKESIKSLLQDFKKPQLSVFAHSGNNYICPHLQFQTAKNGSQIEFHSLQLHCGIMCHVPLSISKQEIIEKVLCPALERKIKGIDFYLKGDPTIQELSSLHFDLEDYVVPVCVFYPFLPTTDPEPSSHMELRRILHRRFIQTEDRPVFRVVCSREAKSEVHTDKRVNIHEQLPPKNFQKEEMVALVQGRYEYRHYGQEDFNDVGWGCAYRSLQTLHSWFLHQHYTEFPVPSHRKIQEVLIERGDKGSDFYGSHEWIGSIEVGAVLEEMIGIEYNVISKAAHQDVSSVARELWYHFRTQGTPVAIGGGVLAYTLLGIYFDDETAEVELLILDPHYKGEDQIDAILKGGWVAWKKPGDKAAAGGPLFVPDAHYNFMCPKRPSII